MAVIARHERDASVPGQTMTRNELAEQWARLTWVATLACLLLAPVAYVVLQAATGWSFPRLLLATVGVVVAVRGGIDVILHRFIPWPNLFGSDVERYKEQDATARRRAWFWLSTFRFGRNFLYSPLIWLILLGPLFVVVALWMQWATHVWDWLLGLVGLGGIGASIRSGLAGMLQASTATTLLFQLGILLLINTLILLGPLMAMGIGQIQAFEPGDANWGVKLDDVRGQAEPKEEIRRVVGLWQSGDVFERAGGKRERGLLFLGAPGTGKTMLAKAVATGFNCPFITIPGSGFAQTFIGMDAVIVRFLAARAKRLARKWGGQCIVFIDEIDAVGTRRNSLGGAPPSQREAYEGIAPFEAFAFHGRHGALNPSGDLVLENRAWRDRSFSQRAGLPRLEPPRGMQTMDRLARYVMPGMFGGGGLALNQLLVVMDGIGNPPFTRRQWNKFNTLLDAMYVIPRRLGPIRLRVPPAKPRKEQIYFIGACNVPLETLDPALTRPGRMGRHIYFRTPTKDDRKDIFDLYLNRVAHEHDLDNDRRRDELARITNGYSPAMIEQICSVALTIAHHDTRSRFGWGDIVEAMTTVEAGTAVNIEYVPEETRAVAIHEAGHAAASHIYMRGAESTRLSIRMRGGSLGHHQALEKDERFSSWRSEQVARLIWALGAMAAEHVFYGENSTGVGGDVASATDRAAWMVGMCGMAPEYLDIDSQFPLQSQADEQRERIEKRLEQLGGQIMNRARNGTGDPFAAVFRDPDKRRTAARFVGQAYVVAYNFVRANRDGVERIADTLVERREMHGDEVIEMLAEAALVEPEIDWTAEKTWPKL